MKEKYSSLLIVLIMTFISFICLTFSMSYSYIIGTKTSNNTQIITTGNINATISYNYTEMELEPMSDENGLAQSDYGKITVSKDNQYSIYYNINLSYELTGLPNGSSTNDFLPAEFIKLAVFEVNDNTVSSTPLMGPVRMADLPVQSANSSDIYQTVYTLLFNKFASGSTNKSYALKVWIDEEVSEDYDENIVYLKMGIYQEPLVSKSIFNLKGKVYNGTSTINNATIKLQNGAVTVTTNSTGDFTINDVPEGTYNFSVNDIETTIHVQSGASNSITKTSSASGTNGTYLQNLAYQYYTTPYKILTNTGNNISTNTNTATTTSYSVPSAYVITGMEAISNQEINNIRIDIASATLISLAS